MMPPTSIDGTDITGATIDGSDVQEITVDGQTVFTAEALPVAYSNLVAWYPFDSTTYGGSDADDVTALFNSGQSGDSTAYDGTVNGFTFSPNGVEDINAGPSSGAVQPDFDTTHNIDLGAAKDTFYSSRGDISIGAWAYWDRTDGPVNDFPRVTNDFKDGQFGLGGLTLGSAGRFNFGDWKTSSNQNGGFGPPTGPTVSTNEWYLGVMTYDSSTGTMEWYVADENDSSISSVDTVSAGSGGLNDALSNESYLIGSDNSGRTMDGRIDDVRIYDKVLTSSEVSDWFTNTKP